MSGKAKDVLGPQIRIVLELHKVLSASPSFALTICVNFLSVPTLLCSSAFAYILLFEFGFPH